MAVPILVVQRNTLKDVISRTVKATWETRTQSARKRIPTMK
jgi:hypothetical protein